MSAGWGLLGAGLFAAGSSAYSSKKQAKAAEGLVAANKDAAQRQQEASSEAIQLLREQQKLQFELQRPYRETGLRAWAAIDEGLQHGAYRPEQYNPPNAIIGDQPQRLNPIVNYPDMPTDDSKVPGLRDEDKARVNELLNMGDEDEDEAQNAWQFDSDTIPEVSQKMKQENQGWVWGGGGIGWNPTDLGPDPDSDTEFLDYDMYSDPNATLESTPLHTTLGLEWTFVPDVGWRLTKDGGEVMVGDNYGTGSDAGTLENELQGVDRSSQEAEPERTPFMMNAHLYWVWAPYANEWAMTKNVISA